VDTQNNKNSLIDAFAQSKAISEVDCHVSAVQTTAIGAHYDDWSLLDIKSRLRKA
jgi:hypothetical protein